jgi:dolichol-phosphate mannosyltransferase
MPPEITIIVPVFDEEDNVVPLADEVTRALAGESRRWELVFVDDASRDRTWTRIQEAHQRDARVRGVRHQRNAGQSAAFWTGLRATGGSLVATLDGDLQNDPADLPKLLAELADADFVCGVRVQRQDNWVRRVSSRLARRARRATLGVDFRDTGCFLRVFRRTALEGVLPFNGWHRFLPVLVHGTGARVKELPVGHRPRATGTSKYGVWNRLGRGLYDLIGVGWYLKRRLRAVPFSESPPTELPL